MRTIMVITTISYLNSSSGSGLHSEDNNDTDTGNDDYQVDDDESDDDSDAPDTSPRRPRMIKALQSSLGLAWDLDEESWGHMVSSMMVAEDVGVRMIKEYIEIEASNVTPQYRSRRGLKLFGDKG